MKSVSLFGGVQVLLQDRQRNASLFLLRRQQNRQRAGAVNTLREDGHLAATATVYPMAMLAVASVAPASLL